MRNFTMGHAKRGELKIDVDNGITNNITGAGRGRLAPALALA